MRRLKVANKWFSAPRIPCIKVVHLLNECWQRQMKKRINASINIRTHVPGRPRFVITSSCKAAAAPTPTPGAPPSPSPAPTPPANTAPPGRPPAGGWKHIWSMGRPVIRKSAGECCDHDELSECWGLVSGVTGEFNHVLNKIIIISCWVLVSAQQYNTIRHTPNGPGETRVDE